MSSEYSYLIHNTLGDHDIDFSIVTGKTILVTGAGGYIGEALCKDLLRGCPKRLIMLDINENSLYLFKRRMSDMDTSYENIITLCIASVQNKRMLEQIFNKYQPNIVFHAAAHKHVPLMEDNPAEAIINNVFGTHNIITTAIKYKVEDLIIVSTDKAVEPSSLMGATKRLSELLLSAYGKKSSTKMAAVRFCNVLGSSGSVVPIFKQQIKDKVPITITSRKMERFFITVEDASKLIIKAVRYAENGNICLLNIHKTIKIYALAQKMIKHYDPQGLKSYKALEIGMRPGEKLTEKLILPHENYEILENNMIINCKASPFSLKDAKTCLKELSRMIQKYDYDDSRLRSYLFSVINKY